MVEGELFETSISKTFYPLLKMFNPLDQNPQDFWTFDCDSCRLQLLVRIHWQVRIELH